MKTQPTIIYQVSLALSEIKQILRDNPGICTLTYRIEGATAKELHAIAQRYSSNIRTEGKESWTVITAWHTEQQGILIVYGERILSPEELARLN